MSLRVQLALIGASVFLLVVTVGLVAALLVDPGYMPGAPELLLLGTLAVISVGGLLCARP